MLEQFTKVPTYELSMFIFIMAVIIIFTIHEIIHSKNNDKQ